MVKGLQTFLKNNRQQLGHGENLRDTQLVIDANNILCVLYTTPTLERNGPDYRNDVYGGDMVKFGQIVKEFFANLKKCNIQPVLVFDGAVNGKEALKDVVVSKEKKSKFKGQIEFERSKKCEELPRDAYEEIIVPQNLNYIFRYMAGECGAQIIQAPYEADSHIARVANELHCPVLSNDSDFIIYALEKGFILLDLFDYKKPHASDNNWSIEATIFSQNKLSQSMPNLKVEVMPLLSILLGNDYVDASVFDGVVKNICNGPNRSRIFSASSFSNRRIANLLNWLGGKSLDESIEHILRLIKPHIRQVFGDAIRMLLRNFQIESEDDFDKELECVYPPQEVASTVHQAPAEFLRRLMEKRDLGSIALYTIFHNTQFSYKIIDDFSLPTSSEVSFRPLKLMLVLLRTRAYENLAESERRDQVKRDSFTLYDRKNGQYSEFTLEPLETLEGFGSLDHLNCYSMISLDTDTKLKLLMACFRYTAEEQTSITETVAQVLSGPFIEQASICFLLIRYIGLESKLAPSPHFVNALMLTLVYYAIKDGQLNRTIQESELFDQLIDHLQPLSVKNNGQIGGKRDQSLYRRIMHFISQLQVTFKGYGLVNSLLGHPFHQPRQELYFNGVLIFRITRLLLSEEETIESICGELPLLIDVCDSLRAQVKLGKSIA